MPLVHAESGKIEITQANFGRMVRDRCLLVDKTLLIKEFVEGQIVSLILRPRRFGKTLTMSMLQHFFSREVGGESTADLFQSFSIAQVDNGGFLKKHQGKYPVISLTFKDLKEPSYKAAIRKLKNIIQALYQEHESLLNKDGISSTDKSIFQHYLEGTVSDEVLESSLQFLSKFLYKTHNKKR